MPGLISFSQLTPAYWVTCMPPLSGGGVLGFSLSSCFQESMRALAWAVSAASMFYMRT